MFSFRLFLIPQFSLSSPLCLIIQIAKYTIILTAVYAADSVLSVAKETEFFHDIVEVWRQHHGGKKTLIQFSGLDAKIPGREQ